MPPINKKRAAFTITSLFSLIIFILMVYYLFKYRYVVDLRALLWMGGLLLSLFAPFVSFLFAHDAWYYGRKRKDVRFA